MVTGFAALQVFIPAKTFQARLSLPAEGGSTLRAPLP